MKHIRLPEWMPKRIFACVAIMREDTELLDGLQLATLRVTADGRISHDALCSVPESFLFEYLSEKERGGHEVCIVGATEEGDDRIRHMAASRGVSFLDVRRLAYHMHQDWPDLRNAKWPAVAVRDVFDACLRTFPVLDVDENGRRISNPRGLRIPFTHALIARANQPIPARVVTEGRLKGRVIAELSHEEFLELLVQDFTDPDLDLAVKLEAQRRIRGGVESNEEKEVGR